MTKQRAVKRSVFSLKSGRDSMNEKALESTSAGIAVQ